MPAPNENAPTAAYLNLPSKSPAPPDFRPGWSRVLFRVWLVLWLLLMLGAYLLASSLAESDQVSQQDELLAAGGGASENALAIGEAQRRELDRILFTQGVPAGVLDKNGALLQPLVEPLAALGELDLVLIGDREGEEVMGLQRVVGDYAVSQNTDLKTLRAVNSILGGAETASEIISLDRRTLLITAGALRQEGQLIGVVVVGQDISRVISALGRGLNGEVALFSGEAQFLGSGFGTESLTLDPALYAAALAQQTAFAPQTVAGGDYQAAYFPLIIGQSPLGVMGVYQTAQTPASALGRQMIGLFAASMVGLTGLVVYVGLWTYTRRAVGLRKSVDRMTAGLAEGLSLRPSQTRPADELGQVGVAVDRFAAAARLQIKQSQQELQQTRRQLQHLMAIIESFPDGVLVQDYEGRILTMNEAARRLLGVRGDSEAAVLLRTWSATAAHRVSPQKALAAGIIPFQEQKDVLLNGRMLRLRGAAVESIGQKRIGSLITLQDVSAESKQAAQRDALIEQISQDVELSMSQRAQMMALEAPTQNMTGAMDALEAFTKEISREARGIQKLITEYHDLATMQVGQLNFRPLHLGDTLQDWLDDWLQIASAAGIDLSLDLPEADWHILGDDRRLGQALSHLMDNAIKYMDGGGQIHLSLAADEASGRAEVRLQDTGVGISLADLPKIMNRFYRGSPRGRDGGPLLVAGSGQGLYFAQKIIAAHGGEISLASVEGGGTQVRLSLALVAPEGLSLPPQAAGARLTSEWDLPTAALIPAAPRQDRPA